MGFVVFLVIIVGIIVIVVVAKKNKQTKAIEDLKYSKAYEVALKIKEALEKDGSNFGEPSTGFNEYAFGYFSCYPKQSENNVSLGIYFSTNKYGLTWKNQSFRMGRVTNTYKGYGIENDNIAVMVTAEQKKETILIKDCSQDMQEYIKIAAEVIENSGHGQSKQIE
ncbi:MAG: hypothetical protein LBB89_05650 [Treponema sp.]|jgi:hypothetical protein|nr:hypothetical protein [Treponema sp.]